MKNKYIAGFLAIVFGGIGLHKLYLGKPFQWLLYIVLFFIFAIVPVLLGLVEGIIYLTTDKQKFQEKYKGKTIFSIISDKLGTKKDKEDFALGLLAILIISVIYIIMK